MNESESRVEPVPVVDLRIVLEVLELLAGSLPVVFWMARAVIGGTSATCSAYDLPEVNCSGSAERISSSISVRPASSSA